ncbi:PAS domain S-box protein [Aquincola sp. S2]|uniref:histidine kinase n=1 Tax=Pseudaquabacterium terrae TaxID=2732868 RepID=A0ABX2ECE6_9BURK|nr:ATP-binding protein [Aquabacterium terrae]NRF66258.1 PAS domain S-box protein [Aquabacterium terrae]
MRDDLPRSMSFGGRRRWRRALLWAALVMLMLVAQTLLVALTVSYESSRAQEQAEETATLVAAEIRQRAQLVLQGLQALHRRHGDRTAWQTEASALLQTHREMVRIERRDTGLRINDAADSPYRDPLFSRWPRAEMDLETEVACASARRTMSPVFSRSQFVPQHNGLGLEVVDVCVPLQEAGQLVGFGVASIALTALLDELRAPEFTRRHELSFVEADGTRLARSGAVRGAGVYVADRVVDLAGTSLQLRVDAVDRRPSLIPNLATALVLGLSLGLFAVVLLLVRDARRRARAEEALAEALAFRRAMEDSLITGLRARDRDGRIVYVNPAFCAMVGFSMQELQQATEPPYWPPEHVPLYRRRQADRLSPGAIAEPAREGYETLFMRKNGERFPVMVYEAPLVDRSGQHTGWMSAVVDLSAQRKVEDLSRQQQERLQATARLASVGEMASLLSHELNQPLAAIASYAAGSLNLLDDAPAPDALPPDELNGMLRQGLQRIAEQAERAGRVIKSVHDFVRRRHQAHEVIAADALIESVLPLVRLQARKSGARIELDVVQPVPRLKIDRTMVEQVLLNLARNGLQAMESDATPLERRVLTLRVRVVQGRWAAFSVIDAGPGIAPDIGQKLFTPFFTTRSEGMGLGLSLCRTVIEQHGGAIDFEPQGDGGTAFRFTLPLAPTRAEVMA